MARGSARRAAGTPLQKAARMLDKQISTASDKAGKLRAQADELEAGIEPLKASRDALGNVDTGEQTTSSRRGRGRAAASTSGDE